MVRFPAISAIYYALLCEGYDFFAPEKPPEVTQRLEVFAAEGPQFPFFRGVRRSSCEVYPYWPRAAMLETAAFHLTEDGASYMDFSALRTKILSAGNIADAKRGDDLWPWLAEFPAALQAVLDSPDFQAYSRWEEAWLAKQNDLHTEALARMHICLERCASLYASPVRRAAVALSPIKCAYAADYHLTGDTFVFSSGRFAETSVIHEFLHPAVHCTVAAQRENILRHDAVWPDIDRSYMLGGGDAGRLNAFEEYAVRRLTERVCRGDAPESLEAFVAALLCEGA